jgi:hypothetical protein
VKRLSGARRDPAPSNLAGVDPAGEEARSAGCVWSGVAPMARPRLLVLLVAVSSQAGRFRLASGAAVLCPAWCRARGCRPDGVGGANRCCDNPGCLRCGAAAGCAKPPPPPSRPAPPPAPPRGPESSEYWVDAHGRIRTTAFQGSDPGGAVYIRGASWFGLESAACYIGGGDKASIAGSAQFLRDHGFNAVRLPLAASEVLRAARGQPSRCLDSDVYYTHNREWQGIADYLDLLERWVVTLGEHGLLVLLDAHVESPGKWPDDGTLSSENDLASVWEALADRFCADPSAGGAGGAGGAGSSASSRFWNVFGADLKNEPHGMHWGPPPADAPDGLYDPAQRWDAVASRLASRVHRACSRWLLFVEGVDHCKQGSQAFGCGAQDGGPRRRADCACPFPSAHGQNSSVPSSFWGENLQVCYPRRSNSVP